jgi:hypothetical protein
MRFTLQVLVLLLASIAPSASAGYSLFNPEQAEALRPELRKLFGPQSSSFRYDKRMMEAAEIAANRAGSSSTQCCWRYVKTALLRAQIIDSYPKTRFAREAGVELQNQFGFRKLNVSDPYKAPPGSVLVYGGSGAGHVELRSKEGFVSDFVSAKPSPRPLLGVYVKPRM